MNDGVCVLVVKGLQLACYRRGGTQPLIFLSRPGMWITQVALYQTDSANNGLVRAPQHVCSVPDHSAALCGLNPQPPFSDTRDCAHAAHLLQRSDRLRLPHAGTAFPAAFPVRRQPVDARRRPCAHYRRRLQYVALYPARLACSCDEAALCRLAVHGHARHMHHAARAARAAVALRTVQRELCACRCQQQRAALVASGA
jgi:hypothetical protein